MKTIDTTSSNLIIFVNIFLCLGALLYIRLGIFQANEWSIYAASLVIGLVSIIYFGWGKKLNPESVKTAISWTGLPIMIFLAQRIVFAFIGVNDESTLVSGSEFKQKQLLAVNQLMMPMLDVINVILLVVGIAAGVIFLGYFIKSVAFNNNGTSLRDRKGS